MTTPRPHVCWEWRQLASVVRWQYFGALVVAVCTVVFVPNAHAQLEEPLDLEGSTGQGAIDAPQVVEAAAPAQSRSAAAQDVDLDTKLDRVGSITLRDANLGDWLFAIRQEWGINIVYSSNDVKDDMVHGEFRDATLREVLDAILLTRGYGYQRIGSSLMILPESKMGQMKPQFSEAIIRLEFNDPREVAASATTLLSPGGIVRPILGARSVYFADLPERLVKVREHITVLETNAREVIEEEQRRQELIANAAQGEGADPGLDIDASVELDQEAVNVYRLRFVDAESILETVQGILGPEGRISVLPEENKIIVMAMNATLHGVTEVIRRLDVPRPQVRITALLYDVNTEELEKLGFNWSKAARARFNASGDPLSLFQFDSSNFSQVAGTTTAAAGDAAADMAATVTTLPPGGLLRLQHLSQYFDLNTVVQAFSELEGARLLARPTVVAYDGVQASFRSVSEIPVQQLTQTAEGGSIGTTEFREAGITLTVTPRINDDGSLRLQIAPEFSVLAGFQSGQPIIDRRSASTTVHLYDGESVVIGGLLRRNELETQRGVPGLKNLKYFGPLFRNHDTTVGESELLVFVRAEIIGPRPEKVPRNYVAEVVLNEAMERIPVAASHPILPHCGDPYCPYHSPPPRWVSHGMVEGEFYGDPTYGTPDGSHENLPQPHGSPPAGPIEPPAAGIDTNDNAEYSHRPNPAVRGLPANHSSRDRVHLPGFQLDPPANDAPQADQQTRYNPIRRLPHISHETDSSQLVSASANLTQRQVSERRRNNGAMRPLPRPEMSRMSPRPRQQSHRSTQQEVPPSENQQNENSPRTATSWLKRFMKFE